MCDDHQCKQVSIVQTSPWCVLNQWLNCISHVHVDPFWEWRLFYSCIAGVSAQSAAPAVSSVGADSRLQKISESLSCGGGCDEKEKGVGSIQIQRADVPLIR